MQPVVAAVAVDPVVAADADVAGGAVAGVAVDLVVAAAGVDDVVAAGDDRVGPDLVGVAGDDVVAAAAVDRVVAADRAARPAACRRRRDDSPEAAAVDRVVAALDAAARVGLADVADELALEVPAGGDVVVAADDLPDRVAGVAGDTTRWRSSTG